MQQLNQPNKTKEKQPNSKQYKSTNKQVQAHTKPKSQQSKTNPQYYHHTVSNPQKHTKSKQQAEEHKSQTTTKSALPTNQLQTNIIKQTQYKE